MRKKSNTTTYIVRIAFKNMEENIFFYLPEEEAERLEYELDVWDRGDSFLTFTDISGALICVNTKMVQSIYSLFEVRPIDIKSDDEDDESWIVAIQLADTELLYIQAESPEAAMSLYSKITGTFVNPRFLSLEDCDGETFFFNADELLYLKIPKAIMDEISSEDDE